MQLSFFATTARTSAQPWARTNSTITITTLTGNGTHGLGAEGGVCICPVLPGNEHFVKLCNSILAVTIASPASVDSRDDGPGQWGNDVCLMAGNIVGTNSLLMARLCGRT